MKRLSTIPALGTTDWATATSSEARAAYDGVAVVIPAYNEEASIGGLTAALRARRALVAVVDDGSTDGTAAAAERAGAQVLSHPQRRGKGAAIRTGLAWAWSRRSAWVVLMDGDGQHAPADADRVLRAAQARGLDLCVGERRFTLEMPVLRRLTNVAMSAVIRALSGAPIGDSQCGLRALSRAAAGRLVPHTNGYEVESEMILRAARLGLRVGTAPIDTIYPASGKSSIRPLSDAARWLAFIAGARR